MDLINFAEARNWRSYKTGWTLCNRACPPSLCASPLGKIFFLFLSLFFSVSRVIFTILTLEIRELRGLRSDNFVLSEETRPVSIHHAYRDEGGERMGRRENIYLPFIYTSDVLHADASSFSLILAKGAPEIHIMRAHNAFRSFLTTVSRT